MNTHTLKRLFPHAVPLCKILPGIRSCGDATNSLRSAVLVLPLDTATGEFEQLLKEGAGKKCAERSLRDIVCLVIESLFQKDAEPANVLAFGYRKSRPPYHNQTRSIPGVESVFPNTTTNMLLDSTDWALLPEHASEALCFYLLTHTLIFMHIPVNDSYLQVCGLPYYKLLPASQPLACAIPMKKRKSGGDGTPGPKCHCRPFNPNSRDSSSKENSAAPPKPPSVQSQLQKRVIARTRIFYSTSWDDHKGMATAHFLNTHRPSAAAARALALIIFKPGDNDIPVRRLASVAPLLEAMMHRHRNLPYRTVLRHHCPFALTHTYSSLVSQYLPFHKVGGFVKAVLVRLVPSALVGSVYIGSGEKHNNKDDCIDSLHSKQGAQLAGAL